MLALTALALSVAMRTPTYTPAPAPAGYDDTGMSLVMQGQQLELFEAFLNSTIREMVDFEVNEHILSASVTSSGGTIPRLGVPLLGASEDTHGICGQLQQPN